MKTNLFPIVLLFLVFFMACKETPSQLELPVLFTDEMVLQQETNVAIWGNAVPGTTIKIDGSWGASATAEAKEDSSWLTHIETPKAGGPFEMTIQNSDSTLVIKNILMGEVWLCSGQSNMEMPLTGWPPNDTINNSAQEIASANYPEIRMFTVQKKYSIKGLKDVNGQWKSSTPENAGDFSATAYFFGRQLYKELNVPIGLIHSSWGGTPAEAWIRGEKLMKDKDYSSLEENLPKLQKAIIEHQSWLENHQTLAPDFNSASDPIESLMFSDKLVSKPEFDDSKWSIMELPKFVEETEVGGFDGVLWFRKEVEIPASWASKEIELNLGPIDDRDWTYFNGELIGSMPENGVWNVARKYKIPAKFVKAGKATIAVRVIDTQGGGGIYGNDEKIELKLKSESISLENQWKYTAAAELKNGIFYLMDIAKNELIERPKNDMQEGQYTPTMLYNGMIAPLIPYTIKGTIWYQGESNVGRSDQYSRIFPILIENWRQDFENQEMPFYYVQIAPYNYGGNDKSSSAKLRDAQRRTLSVKKTGMAVTLDIGNVSNIHPGNKQEVGKRLALLALTNDYNKDIVSSGPVYSKMEISGNQILISFAETNGGLLLKDESTTAFEIAGSDGVYYPAKAVVDGEQIVLASAKVTEPVSARYAFYDDSEAVLFNNAGLPASSFTTEKSLND